MKALLRSIVTTLVLGLVSATGLAGPAPASAPVAEAAGAQPAAGTPADRTAVLQAVIEALPSLMLKSVGRPGLLPATIVPERAPVLAVTRATEERLPVQAMGYDVVYLTRSQLREQMLINFLKVDSIQFTSPGSAEVRVFYPYRALGGTLRLSRGADGWTADTTGLSFNPPGAQLFYTELFEGQACRDGTEYARWQNAFAGRDDGRCPAPPAARKPAKGKKTGHAAHH